jgi:hypothetical protein
MIFVLLPPDLAAGAETERRGEGRHRPDLS